MHACTCVCMLAHAGGAGAYYHCVLLPWGVRAWFCQLVFFYPVLSHNSILQEVDFWGLLFVFVTFLDVCTMVLRHHGSKEMCLLVRFG